MQSIDQAPEEWARGTGTAAEPRGELLLRFERLLSGVSSMLIAASSAETPARIEEALRAVVEFFGVDRCCLGQWAPDGSNIIFHASYGRPGAPVTFPVDTLITNPLPWYTAELVHGRVVRLCGLSGLPPEASREREFCLGLGLKANLTVPVLIHGAWRYGLSLDSFASEVDWPEDLIPRLRILAEMFAHAFEHSRTERERERLFDAERAARSEADKAHGRAAFLAEASRILASSLDYETTLQRVAELSVPPLGDWCFVAVLGLDGSVRRTVAGKDAGPAAAALLREARRFTPCVETRPGIARVVLSGHTIVAQSITDAELAPEASSSQLSMHDPEFLYVLRALGLRSYVCVPLVARDQVLGALTFGRAREHTPDADELSLAEDLGRRAAVAVDNGRLYQASQQAIRVRDDFLSIAAHELRTPCTSLQLAVQALSRSGFAGAPEEASRSVRCFLSTIEHQVVNLNLLVDRLLDVSRIAGGQLAFVRSEVDLADVARTAVARLQDPLHVAGSALTVDAPEPVVGHWDRARLEQVATNLLANAIKYGAGAPIEVAVCAQEGTAQLIVRDHGIGIPLAEQSRIFGRFERAVSSEHYGGLGLGLYVVQRVVEQLGGTVACESAPSEGATFTVTLPRAEA
jgi:signal transduction histidine kinase